MEPDELNVLVESWIEAEVARIGHRKPQMA
jgi:hypothetical protein